LNRRLRLSRLGLARRAQMLAQASDAIVGLDLDNRVIAWNAAAEKLLGWPAPEAAGRPIVELVPDFPAAGLVQNRAAGDGRWSAEVALTPRSGGKVITEVAVSPLRDDHGAAIGSIADIRDVSEVRRLEEQYRQAQKLESIGRLAGGIAHDFNNLLTVINGYSDLLMSRMEQDHPQRPAIAEIGKAGQKAARMVQQLLAIGRKQLLQLEVLDLNAMIGEDLVMLRRLIGEQIELETSFHHPSPQVRADRAQLQQVLLNLVVNARDAMPEGGKLKVETRETRFGAADAARLKDMAPGGYAILSVADTGTGMDAATKQNLFEPFFTTKAPGKGSGLGLSMVFGIVKQCGGHITVNSEPGAGAVFCVYLPLVEAPAPAVSHDRPAPESLGGAETVVVVEDQAEVRKLVFDVLASFGYQVLAAPGPEEALSLLGERSFQLDLLITDVVMPGMNGRELAERIRLVRPDVGILFISGYGQEAAGDDGVLSPRAYYLPKPFTPDALARKVRQALDAARG
jgi:PAS domain S-box-containing protein